MWQITYKPFILFKNLTKSSYYLNIWKTLYLYIKRMINNDFISTKQFLFYLFLERFSEKIIFNRIYNFVMEEELLNPNKSSFC